MPERWPPIVEGNRYWGTSAAYGPAEPAGDGQRRMPSHRAAMAALHYPNPKIVALYLRTVGTPPWRFVLALAELLDPLQGGEGLRLEFIHRRPRGRPGGLSTAIRDAMLYLDARAQPGNVGDAVRATAGRFGLSERHAKETIGRVRRRVRAAPKK